MTKLRAVIADYDLERLSEDDLGRVRRQVAVKIESAHRLLLSLRREVLGLELELEALASDGEAIGEEMERRAVP